MSTISMEHFHLFPFEQSFFSFLDENFENLTDEFHVFYVLNMYIKFRSNRILFTI